MCYQIRGCGITHCLCPDPTLPSVGLLPLNMERVGSVVNGKMISLIEEKTGRLYTELELCSNRLLVGCHSVRESLLMCTK